MAYYPGQKVQHSKPRRITVTKILLLVAMVAVVYLAVTFFPPYWHYYQSSSVMSEQGQLAYDKRRPDHSWGQIQSAVHKHVRAELLSTLKIPAEDLHLEVEKKSGAVFIRASWKFVARWPLISKTTTLRFDEEIDFPAR